MELPERLMSICSLTDAEKTVAAFIVKNSDTVCSMPIQDLARRTHASTTTVLRLCKKIGFHGFKELKARLALDYRSRLVRKSDVNINLPFDEFDSEIEIASKIAGLTNDTVASCLQRFDKEAIRTAVSRLSSASSIVAIGVSDSFIRLIDFQNKMLKINVYVKITYQQPDQAYLCTHAHEEDVALLVSYSGRTAEILNEIRILRNGGVPIVAITSDPLSPLGLEADTLIELPSDENTQIANYSLSSQVAIEYALNVIFSCIYAARYRESKSHLLESRKLYLHQ
ncbi:transcriptional regulator, RpiR family [Coriobacterium glomerans PW2]|uniref:Transcriptional regulator, RpiR family n=1 Tax=Coriobacterium glomerans (strain ATCC 49209 / DSM 20642 / JCM 10262 / PW2) TaxID=700015 RepID=F2N9X5_CORGP|nr:MurR/RpiR family transcriptional regulator [Coriobacterium glomerans]AEB06230.1 transcriptional regulator, RpiR family [Coriobacterium glomerans PW2]